MYIGPLPAALRDIQEDGRTNQEIVSALEAGNVAIFHKGLFKQDAAPIPTPGTPYNFLATVGSELPWEIRASAEMIFEVAQAQQDGKLGKPSLRSTLLLMERMTRERLYADIVFLNEPILNPESGNRVLISMGREHEDGVTWITAVLANYIFDFDSQVIIFLGPES